MSSGAPNNDRAFPQTIWPLVDRAGQGDPHAVEELLRCYKSPLIAYLLYKVELPSLKAEQLFQDFVGDKIVQKNCIAAANPEKGKFRNFILTVFLNRVRAELRKDDARRPEGGFVSADDPDAKEIPDDPKPEMIERTWWQSVIAEVLSRVKADYEENGKAHFWGLFESRIVQPMLQDEEPLDYEIAMERFGFSSPQKAFAALLDAKRKFKSYLQEVIDQYEQAPNEARTEIRELKEFAR